MSQHDYNISNQTAAASRTDINNVLAAILSTNSGTSAPATTVGNMIWYDTTNNILQIRNEGNTAWITLGTVDQINSKFEPNQTLSTQAEAEAGTNNTKMMTALRVLQSINSNVTATPSCGVGQSWQSVSRSASTWYQNTTGNPIMAAISIKNRGAFSYVGVSTSSYVTIIGWTPSYGDDTEDKVHTFIVPDDYYYMITCFQVMRWTELR
jgi:hypothetical protein